MTTLSTSIDVVDLSDGVVTNSACGRTVQTVDAADLPLLTIDPVYGESVQDGTPTPDAPQAILSVTPGLISRDVDFEYIGTNSGRTGRRWSTIGFGVRNTSVTHDGHPSIYYHRTEITTDRWSETCFDFYEDRCHFTAPISGRRIYASLWAKTSDSSVWSGEYDYAVVAFRAFDSSGTKFLDKDFSIRLDSSTVTTEWKRFERSITISASEAAKMNAPGTRMYFFFSCRRNVDLYLAQLQLSYTSGVDYKDDTSLPIVSSTGSTTYLDMTDPSTGEPIELHGLDDTYRDILTIDASGHAVVEKRCGEAVYDGVTNKVITLARIIGSYRIFQSTSQIDAKTPVDNIPRLLCDRYSPIDDDVQWNTTSGYHVAQNPYVTSSIRFGTSDTSLTSVDLFNQHLQSYPATLVFPLATPYTIDLGYVDLPEVTDNATVYVAAEVQPQFCASWWTKAGAEVGKARNSGVELDLRATCSTASTTAAKTASIDRSVGFYDGLTITVHFDNPNTAANATFQLTSAGVALAPKPIYLGANPVDGLYNWYAGEDVILVYSADAVSGGAWVMANHGEARITTTYGSATFFHPQNDLTQGVRIGTYGTAVGVQVLYNQKLRAVYGSEIYLFGNANGGSPTSLTYPYLGVKPSGIETYASATEYSKLTSSGFDVYKSGVSVAYFAETARLGKADSSRFLMNSDSLQAYNSSNAKYFEVSSNGIYFGNSNVTDRLSSTESVANTALSRVTIKDTRNDNQSPQWYITNYPKQVVEEFKFSNVIGVSGETYCYLETQVPWGDASGGYPKQHVSIRGQQLWRVGTSGTTWSAWTDATQTATNYITTINDSGITVHPASYSANYVKIDGNGFYAYYNSSYYTAQMSDGLYVYAGGSLRTKIGSGTIDLYAGAGTYPKVNIGSSGMTVYKTAATRVNLGEEISFYYNDVLKTLINSTSMIYFGSDTTYPYVQVTAASSESCISAYGSATKYAMMGYNSSFSNPGMKVVNGSYTTEFRSNSTGGQAASTGAMTLMGYGDSTSQNYVTLNLSSVTLSQPAFWRTALQLGSLATKDSVAAGNVSGLGSLATLSSIGRNSSTYMSGTLSVANGGTNATSVSDKYVTVSHDCNPTVSAATYNSSNRITSMGYGGGTYTFTKSGYYPVAISGWNSASNVNVYECHLTSQSNGSATVKMYCNNATTTQRTPTVYIHILWVKL